MGGRANVKGSDSVIMKDYFTYDLLKFQVQCSPSNTRVSALDCNVVMLAGWTEFVTSETDRGRCASEVEREGHLVLHTQICHRTYEKCTYMVPMHKNMTRNIHSHSFNIFNQRFSQCATVCHRGVFVLL